MSVISLGKLAFHVDSRTGETHCLADQNNSNLVWGIILDHSIKLTKKKTQYAILTIIDDTFQEITVRCWGFDSSIDEIYNNRPYLLSLNYDPKYGFSAYQFSKNFKLLQ